MKKLIAILLVAGFVSLAVGCGGTATTKSSPGSGAAPSTGGTPTTKTS